jgi:NTE family protein
MGVAQGLLAERLAIDAAPALGTSGGAWAAAAVFAGLDHQRVVETTRYVRLPTWRPGRLYQAARAVFGEAHEPLLTTSVVRLRDGRRMLLSGADHSIADIVAASSSVPGMVAPHRVSGQRFIDGGARSWISADLAPDADRLLVIAPGIAPSFGLFGVALAHHVGVEIRRWKRRTGGRVAILRVEEDLGRRVTRWRDMFDHALANEAYERGRVRTHHEVFAGERLIDFLGLPTSPGSPQGCSKAA